MRVYMGYRLLMRISFRAHLGTTVWDRLTPHCMSYSLASSLVDSMSVGMYHQARYIVSDIIMEQRSDNEG